MKPTVHSEIVGMLKQNDGGPLPLDCMGVYVMASQSDPMDYHTVIHISEGVYDCSCKGGRYRGTCDAIKRVRGDNA